MFRLARAIAAAALVVPATPVAQTPHTPTGALARQDELMRAQAGAVRPGDRKLSCAALESDMVAAMTSPAVQSHVARSRAQTKDDLARMKAATAGVPIRGALTVFASLTPVGSSSAIAAAPAQTAAQPSRTAQNVQKHLDHNEDMLAILPQLMRGQRLMELAALRRCTWMLTDDTADPAGALVSPAR